MAEWMKKRWKLQRIANLLKDRVLLGMAASKLRKFPEIEAAILRAIDHGEDVPSEEAMRSLLAIGRGSRMYVAQCVGMVMDRLDRSRSWAVSAKCLIVVHRCLFEGGFMFQDQFGVHPARGGKNYLNLSGFRDRGSAFAWQASAWVRWYARFIEQWIQTSIAIGDFLDVKQKQQHQQQQKGGEADFQDKLKGMMDVDLEREVSSLSDLLRLACGWEAEKAVMEHRLVKEGVCLATFVTLRAYEEIKLRLREVGLRARVLEPSRASALLRVCDSLSESSSSLAYLFEMCDDPLLRQNRTVCREVPLSHRELMELREALRSASSENVPARNNRRIDDSSIDPGFFFFFDPPLIPPLQSQSMRRSKPVVDGRKVGRAGSMSHLAYYEAFL